MSNRSNITPAAVRTVALQLFAEKGYHGTAMSEIAARLEIRTPSLYNHIESKQALLADIVLDTSQAVYDDFAAAIRRPEVEGNTPAQLSAAVQVYAHRHATHRHEALVVNSDVAALDEPVRSQVFELRRTHERGIRDLIDAGRKSGDFHVDQPALASFGILEMCVAIARWFRDDGPLSAEATASSHAEFALRLVGYTGSLTGLGGPNDEVGNV
ncbi:MAG: TetR/AcrR family transcriptional regulator [Acidimicrobiales bacterium]